MPMARERVVQGWVCRPVATRDLDGVARAWLDGWLSNNIALAEQPTFPNLRARIAREIEHGGWEVVVAEIDDAVAGFVAINRSAAILEQIFVAPRFHRRGIGQALLEVARQSMPAGFSLWTHGDNSGAAAFYERAGMAFVGPGVHPKQGHRILTFAFGPLTQ